MKQAKKHTFTKEQLCIPDDGMIHLHDLSFDFEDYFDRFEKGEMDEDEKRDYSARVMGLFCKSLWEHGDTRAVPYWVANYLAEKLCQSLGGVPWGDLVDLPWDRKEPFLTKNGQRAFETYAHVHNTLLKNEKANITDLIAEAAKKFNVSYETARKDYYDMKNDFDRNGGIREKFLIQGGEF